MEPELDWGDIQVFVAIARAGTLSAAAQQLGLSQPTVGRRLRNFERKLGTQLFHRQGVCLRLTEAGESLKAVGENMDRAARSARSVVIGRDAGLAGRLVVTAAEWLSVRVLTKIAAEFTEQYPAIVVDLLAEPNHVSLVRHDADIALRLARFAEAEVSQRRVGTVSFGLYAAPTYLQRRGYPDFRLKCRGHTIVALTHARERVADVAWLDEIASGARIVVRCNGREAQARSAAAGAGLTCLPRILGDATAGLQLLESPPPPARTLWSGVHSAAKHIPRLRVFLDFAAVRLEEIIC